MNMGFGYTLNVKPRYALETIARSSDKAALKAMEENVAPIVKKWEKSRDGSADEDAEGSEDGAIDWSMFQSPAKRAKNVDEEQ